jgi:hypothetical protein
MSETNSFPSQHPLDRNFFLLMISFAWLALLSGFINDAYLLTAAGRFHFPWIVHLHALVYWGWMVLFTAQLLYIRKNQFQLHKKLGMAGVAMAVMVVIMGIATALITEYVKFGTQYSDPAFVSVMLGDMLVFTGLAASGLYFRKNPSAHKRLMLLSTLILTDAGFGRGLSVWLASLMGKPYWEYSNFSDGFWPFVVRQLSCPFTLILFVGIYDLITRRRLHPAYVLGVLWALSIDVTAGWLYFNDSWLKIATKLIGH